MRATLLKAAAAVGVLLLLVGVLALGRSGGRAGCRARTTSWTRVARVGGGPVPPGHDASGTLDVAALKGPQGGAPDARFTLTAKQGKVRLASGRTIDALTFNGRSPGPELRVREGSWSR